MFRSYCIIWPVMGYGRCLLKKYYLFDYDQQLKHSFSTELDILSFSYQGLLCN